MNREELIKLIVINKSNIIDYYKRKKFEDFILNEDEKLMNYVILFSKAVENNLRNEGAICDILISENRDINLYKDGVLFKEHVKYHFEGFIAELYVDMVLFAKYKDFEIKECEITISDEFIINFLSFIRVISDVYPSNLEYNLSYCIIFLEKWLEDMDVDLSFYVTEYIKYVKNYDNI